MPGWSDLVVHALSDRGISIADRMPCGQDLLSLADISGLLELAMHQ